MKELDDIAPKLIGGGAGRIQIDQFGSEKWRATLSIFNGPQFVKEAATPAEAQRLVLIEAEREAGEKMRRYRQAINDRAGDDLATAAARRAREDAKVAALNAVEDDFEAMLG